MKFLVLWSPRTTTEPVCGENDLVVESYHRMDCSKLGRAKNPLRDRLPVTLHKAVERAVAGCGVAVVNYLRMDSPVLEILLSTDVEGADCELALIAALHMVPSRPGVETKIVPGLLIVLEKLA